MVFEVEPRFEYRQDRFLRRLHLDEGSGQNKNIRKKIGPMVARASSLVRLHGLVRLGRQDFETGIRQADRMEGQAIFLCWAGREAVEEIERLSAQDKLMEAYLLDQLVNDSLFYASVALEEAADRLLRGQGLQICQVFYPEDSCPDSTLSARLLDLVKEEKDVEVTLNQAGLFQPPKTICYVAGTSPIRQETGTGPVHQEFGAGPVYQESGPEPVGQETGTGQVRQGAGAGQGPEDASFIKKDGEGPAGCSRGAGRSRHNCAICKKEGCAFRIPL